MRLSLLATLACLAAGCGGSGHGTSPLCTTATPKQVTALDKLPSSMDLRGRWLVVAGTTNPVIDDGSVIAIDLTDGTVRGLGSARPLPLNVAVGDTDAYWMELGPRDDPAAGAIVRAPLDSAGSVSKVLQTTPSGADMLFDEGTLYFRTDPTGLSALAPATGDATPLLADVAPLYFAANAHNVYWTDCGGMSVDGVDKAGGDKLHLADAFCPYGIAADDVDLFFADLYTKVDEGSYVDGPQLHHVPVGGGANTIVSETAQPITNLVMDGESVYFGQEDGVYRIARAGGDAVMLAAGAPQDVAIDDACVYWTDSEAKAVFTAPK